MNNFLTYISSELSSALGWTFIHSLWQGCLLMVLFLTTQKIFKLNTAGKYWGALSTMVLLLFISFYTLIQYLNTSETIGQFADSPTFFISEVLSSQNVPAMDKLEQYLPMIAWFWIAGAILYAIRLGGGFIQIHRLKTKGVTSVPENWRLRFSLLLAKTKIDKTVRLFQSSRIDIPMVLGYFKPVILLPIGMTSGLPTDQVEAILLHELSHIKRHDFLINVIQSIIEVIFYYHPVVWWLSSQIRMEREHCCDDQIIAYGINKLTYAHALTNIKTTNFTQNKLTMGLANNKNDLLNRIKRLMEGRDQSSTNFYTKGIPLLILITVLMGFSWYRSERLPKEEDERISQIALAPISSLEAIQPIMVETLLDTSITVEPKSITSKSRSNTTIIWTDEDGTIHEIIEGSDESSSVDWDAFAQSFDHLDRDFDFIFDLGDLSESIEAVSNLDFNFDNSFDIHVLDDLDSLPELHLDHMKNIERELERAQEILSNMHSNFDYKQEKLSEEQKVMIKKQMRDIEFEMRDQLKQLKGFHYRSSVEHNDRELRDELRDERHRERNRQRDELQKERREFSTERIEKRMEEKKKELEEKEKEMTKWEENYERYQKELIKQLKTDKYLKKGEKLKNFEMSNSNIKVNGEAIEAKDLDTYRELKRKYLEE